LKKLVQLIGPHLKAGDTVLDVGCGFGQLGRAIMDAFPQVRVEGVESVKRGGELIPVTAYEGTHMPWEDGAFDAVILADVLHHDHDPDRLLKESARISRRLVIIKDHLREGFLAQQRISLLDWAANAGYQVPCTYRYNNLAEWHKSIGLVSSKVVEERTSIDIYPPVFNELLGKGLHYFAVCAR
jgi:SAM-dependent methyltransferase